MESLLISACFLGVNCKYDGGNNALPEDVLTKLREKYCLVPVCPENAGGLPTPREPSERKDGGVWSRSGRDVTAEYEKGAQIALELVRQNACKAALLKERSPSCGHDRIYDGTFSGTLVPGNGTAAEKLLAAGIPVYGESEVHKLI
ncbi:MAG: DUF523 domain-containing protein [Oscillospiraceae bacterium]|nr:DUF523 domain-containing protein [Oscillospiraceae bacterium]